MNGNVQHRISLEKAIDLTARFRKRKKEMAGDWCLSETFDREAIESLLNVEGCASMRIYYGMKEDLTVHAVLVAADKDGNDILPIVANQKEEQAAAKAATGIILEDATRCPPQCPKSSKLNGD